MVAKTVAKNLDRPERLQGPVDVWSFTESQKSSLLGYLVDVLRATFQRFWAGPNVHRAL